ncbi:NIF-domain-containing protein, partial [Trametopsis cervina]
MNSLTYLSRQLDVLAAARTPPSTPSLEKIPLYDHDDVESSVSLKRVQTWSQKSFVPSPSSGASTAPWNLKRSYSSPAEVGPGEPSSSSAPPTSARASTIPLGSRPPSRRPSISSPEKVLRPNAVDNIFYRMFFVRVLLSLWHYVSKLWHATMARFTRQGSHQVIAEEVTDDDEKDTEDERKDEKPSIDVHPAPPGISSSQSQAAVASSAAHIHPEDALRTTPPPGAAARKTPLHLQKTLVLDLDETLIHSTSRPMYNTASGTGILSSLGFGRRDKGVGYTVEVVLGGRSTVYHVYKRPFVDYFLRKVSAWYTLVIFTASMQEYADPVIDWLDAGRGILGRRLFRESCTQLPNGSYTKDLSIIEQDLSRVCLVDNSPICYSMNESNGIPIEGWTNDPHDEALLDLLPVLDSLRFTSDVRRVLGIR